MELTQNMFALFDREDFSFKKLKIECSSEELDQIKASYREVWQAWKNINLVVEQKLPAGLFTKVHIESWTNGWNLRDHFWAAYRLNSVADQSPCLAVMLDKKQLQVYLMFQHYKSEQRGDNPATYNLLLKDIPTWAKNITPVDWYLWNKNESEFAEHLSLKEYLSNQEIQINFNKKACQCSFLLGKFAFRNKDKVLDMEDFIEKALLDLLPLYQLLTK